MSRSIPSLNALRAFVSVAKHGNLKDAAAELFVTPSALSHQIKNMEETLKVQLFVRHKDGVSLTSAGNLIFGDLADAFNRIRQTLDKLERQQGGGFLNISMLSTFAMRWFIPRLSSFQQLHPEIEIRISTSVTQVDFKREDIDCAIRSGNGHWPGLHAEYLFSETFTPVCSPKLAASLKQPQDLKHFNLLHAQLRPDDWHVWLNAVEAGDITPRHEQTFESRNFAIQAAVDGLGIAIVDPSLVAEELKSGRLVLPFSQTLTDKSAFYFVYPEASRSQASIIALQNWLLDQVRRS